MTRTAGRAAVLAFAALVAAAPASAQVVQSIQFGVGGFVPRGFASRDPNDVLLRDFLGAPLPGSPQQTDALVFDISDFRSGHVFGGWNLAFGHHIEIGAEVGLYGRSVPTFYQDVVNDQTNGDINQTLRLRVVPISGIVRFLPFGSAATVQPYVGVGVSAMHFNYSEIGDFVDEDTLDIKPGRFVASGFAPGAMVIGGVRFPLGGDIYGMSIEGRYLMGKGDLTKSGATFLTDRVDLGGGQVNFTFLVRF